MEKSFDNILDNLNVDDVVVLKGKIINFQGNVVNVNREEGVFEVYVTHCDDEDTIGNVMPINDEIMGMVFHSLEIKRYKRSRADILLLMDFALSIKDFEWCKEIHAQLENFDKRETFLKSRRMVV